MEQKPGPNSESAAYRAMCANWRMIADIRAGVQAVRAKNEAYLPKFEDEDTNDYKRRLASAPWRPEWADAFAALIAKPFTKDIEISGADTPEAKAFLEDVDLRGNNLTQFAKLIFENAVADGVTGIFVEHTPTTGMQTRAEEIAAGARAYFIPVRALNILAVYFAMRNGKLLPVYARMKECVVERDGFGETEVEQIRELEPGLWRTYRQNEKKDWVLHEEGVTSLDFVPLHLFFTGERKGDYEVRPPLLDLAYMQIELYQALSRQDEVLNFAGFPMLSANGLTPPKDGKIAVGPRRILFAPPGESPTSWGFIQPDAANIQELRSHVESITNDMRRLGMQPMVQKAGGITATATSIEGAKAHSVLQSWVMGLKDAIEQAFVIAAAYRNEQSAIEVDICTDFVVEPFAQAPLAALAKARDLKDISRKAHVEALRRFSVLGEDFDPDEDEQELAEEQAGLDPEMEIDPKTGKVIEPDPQNQPLEDRIPAA